jgi:pantetheine-phosphate adenylyltransferase
VAVYDQPLKKILFPPEKRIELVKLTLNNTPNIKVTGYSGLTVDFCHKIEAQVIVRGLRVFSDFEYEFRMALANHSLSPDIEVVALITNKDHTFLSGSTVREIAALGGDVSFMVPPVVEQALKDRFRELGSDQSIVPHTSLRD